MTHAALCARAAAATVGTNMNKDVNGFQQPPQLLVATPGRLNDHLQNSGQDVLMQVSLARSLARIESGQSLISFVCTA